MREKLNSSRGETLVEVMASILIGALSVALLFTAVTASVRMDRIAKAADEAHGAVLSAAEAQTAPVTDTAIVPAGADKVEVGTSVPGVTDAEVGVEYYGGMGALSYALPSGGGGP